MNNVDLTQPIRGSRDFYPTDMAIRNWLFNSWRQVAKSFGFEEIDGPILENFDLFAVKSGEELVNQQMYTLNDRDKRKLGIRPELTPTFSRMVAKRQNELVFPLRWIMFGNVWRYERPQTGRSRDFWQWELNLVGGEENTADAEVIAVAVNAMKALGFTSEDIVLRINDRRIMQQQLTDLGISPDQYPLVTKLIDRKEKITAEEFISELAKLNLTDVQIKQLIDFLDNPVLEKYPKLVKLFNLLENYGVRDFCVFDPVIVRGITYYTGTVFECFDRNKDLRSIFGGGRFDDLVETFGGGKIPVVGFAIGDVVVTELLRRLNKLPQLSSIPTQILVSVFSPDLFLKSLSLSQILRTQGINTELYPDPNAKLDKQLKYASKKGIPFVAILGPEETQNNLVTLKNLTIGEQQKLTQPELIKKLKT